MPPIDTTTVEGRRPLRFESLDAMLADARSLAAVPQARLRRLGNWTLGQALNHIAEWIDYPYAGYPPELVIPPQMQVQARAAKQRILSEPMRPGEHLPGIPAGTLAVAVVPTDVGLRHLEAAAARLRSSEPVYDDPAFGRITAHEWTQMSLRHAELHLSFFVPA